MLRGGATNFYHADGLGSVTSLSNTAGAIAQTYSFDSFGNHTGSSGSLTNSFRYTAREFDTETSLYYYRARYYDSGAGRFLGEDPLDFGGGPNFYNYVANNPTVFIDPFGLWHCVAGADCSNLNFDLERGLVCFDICTGRDTAVTSARRPPSHRFPNGSHSRGTACDIGRNSNPQLPRAERCFLQCFPDGYGQEENNDPKTGGTHFHFQQYTVPGGQPYFAPGIRPYAP